MRITFASLPCAMTCFLKIVSNCDCIASRSFSKDFACAMSISSSISKPSLKSFLEEPYTFFQFSFSTKSRELAFLIC